MRLPVQYAQIAYLVPDSSETSLVFATFSSRRYYIQYFFQSLPVHMIYCKTQAAKKNANIPVRLICLSIR